MLLLVPVVIELDNVSSFFGGGGGAVSSSESMISVVSVTVLVILLFPNILKLDGMSRNVGNFFIIADFPSKAIDACGVYTFFGGKFKFKLDGFTTTMGAVDSLETIVDVVALTFVCLFDGDSGLCACIVLDLSMVLLLCRSDVGWAIESVVSIFLIITGLFTISCVGDSITGIGARVNIFPGFCTNSKFFTFVGGLMIGEMFLNKDFPPVETMVV